ncbi:hypothetical protein [Brevundimonas viscosa]|uniref:Uncharacterized protein n=1 Tax=Brevundimonas viscosa TaxID=871741 RepID=A0A1I6P6T5_9CAUL|nr:hypothetical protein [Brevundimonas viscosa]SFS35865.1 hypothetical protein SAMN05192570_0885 [Brevundimonas viscosa]
MSGIIAAAVAVLLQQAGPHPSTQALYEPPAIRPFEPPSDFGREVAEGDGAGEAQRRPLEAPVTVDSYVRSYEASPADAEVAYDQGVASAEIRADQAAGPLDGYWRVMDEDGAVLFDLVLSDAGARIEGGWRGPDGAGAAEAVDGSLRLEGLGTARLERAGETWRARLRADGRTRTVTLTRLR